MALIPLKVDVPTFRRSWVNYAIIAATCFCSLWGFHDAGLFGRWSGLASGHPKPVLAITSTLLHAGWLHLLGNMLFLWIFGNAINCKFGHVGYLGFYLFGALASGMAHFTFQGGPVVGASGAINAVMGAFLVFFPRNDVTIFWIIWFAPGVGRLSSMWIIVYWLAWDILYLALGAETGVAFWAHVGGFAAGFALAALLAAKGWVRPTGDEQTLLQIARARRRGGGGPS
ncbi:MAG: rhomboid family intramembrane serine protease [Planctomycetota bacterium]